MINNQFGRPGAPRRAVGAIPWRRLKTFTVNTMGSIVSSIARKAAGIALILAGAFVLTLVALLAPRCADIPFFSVECVGPYLPVAIPLAGLGIVTIMLGVRLVGGIRRGKFPLS